MHRAVGNINAGFTQRLDVVKYPDAASVSSRYQITRMHAQVVH